MVFAITFATFYLHCYLLVTISYSIDLEVQLVSLHFFIRTSKTLMGLNAFFYGFQPQNVVVMFMSLIKYSYMLTVKTTSDANNSHYFLNALHVF